MHIKGVISLIPTVLLCLPSFAGVLALALNASFHCPIGEWSSISSVSVAAAVFIGWPLLLFAAVVAGVIGLNRGVSKRIKYTHYVIITTATIGTFALTFHFGM